MAESKLWQCAAAVSKLFGTAAKLAKKQAALATLNNVTLPKLYRAIGKNIVGLEKLPPDLLPHRERIRGLEAAIAAKPQQAAEVHSDGFKARATQLARQAANTASKSSADATAAIQIQSAYVSLGKEAVAKYGRKAIPKEIQAAFITAEERISSLNSEISLLKATANHALAVPSRLGAAGIGLYCLSWFLPATGSATFSLSGWEAFRAGLNGSWLFAIASLTNVIACVSIATLLGWPRPSKATISLLRPLLAISFLWNCPLVFAGAGVGYVVWMVSFICLFLALKERESGLEPAVNAINVPLLQGRAAMAAAIFGMMALVLLVNTAARFLRSGSPPAQAETVAVYRESSAGDSPPGNGGERQVQNGTAQMLLNAFITAAAIRHAEEQRIRQQQAFVPAQRPAHPPPQRDYRPSTAPPPAHRGSGAPPARPQQAEGICTKCGWKTGRQVVQTDSALRRSSQTCTQLTKHGEFGIRSCGGVIVWTPVD